MGRLFISYSFKWMFQQTIITNHTCEYLNIQTLEHFKIMQKPKRKRRKKFKIGVTGGIGSGKTTVCRIFKTLGIPIYYADDRAKALMIEDKALIKSIKKIFGAAAYHKDGSLNREHIAGIAFGNKGKLALLNAAVHPAVAEDGKNWHRKQRSVPYTVKEAALLFEAGSYQQLDYIITVTAPEAIRIQRVIKRDKTTKKQVKARIDKQMPEAEKVKLSDFVIDNDGEQALIPQVVAIHRKLLELREK